MSLLRLKRLTDTAAAPTYGSDHAACFDLRADLTGRTVNLINVANNKRVLFCDDSLTLAPGERVLIPTGFVFHIAEGYSMKINSRSGLAWKHGIVVLNSPAVIDSDYTRETFVMLHNTSGNWFTVKHGDRIAQAELMPVLRVEFESCGDRKGGFGSSGVK